MSNFLLRERQRPTFLQPWVQQLRAEPDRLAKVTTAARLLTAIAPQGPYFPDFLTPAEASAGLDAGLEAIERTPRTRLRHELSLLTEARRRRGRKVSDWLNVFTYADTGIMKDLTTIIRRYHQAAIMPHNDLTKACIDADIAHRARAMVNGGAEGLFNSFRPFMHWEAPVLKVQYDVDQELRLDGRGLRLVPSFFCHGSPVSIADPSLLPVLIYPISTEHRWSVLLDTTNKKALEKLLGTTRARVLRALDQGANTTELATLLQTSLASVSRHASTLRDAGLIVSQRYGPSVFHTLTTLGRQLLEI